MRKAIHRRVARTRYRAGKLDPTVQGLLWTTAAGLFFVVLNTIQRVMTQQLDPFQAQFLRYACGLLVMMPLVLRAGFAAYKPKEISGQFIRGAVHTLGLVFWYTALPKIPLADMTAIGFTGPIFIMLGAYLFFKEPMHWDRWLASIIGFCGVMIVVGPRLSGAGGYYNLLMLASAPIFAASFLLTKGLTRLENAQVIVVWQSISVTLFSLPMALLHWQHPSAGSMGRLPDQWRAWQRRPLLPDAFLQHCRHLVHAVHPFSGPGVVCDLRLADFLGCAQPDDTDRRRGNLRSDGVDRPPGGQTPASTRQLDSPNSARLNQDQSQTSIRENAWIAEVL